MGAEAEDVFELLSTEEGKKFEELQKTIYRPNKLQGIVEFYIQQGDIELVIAEDSWWAEWAERNQDGG